MLPIAVASTIAIQVQDPLAIGLRVLKLASRTFNTLLKIMHLQAALKPWLLPCYGKFRLSFGPILDS